MRKFIAAGVAIGLSGLAFAQQPATEITRWQDGKDAALALTYDDSTINQFRIALPLMNERGLVGTFFVITSQIQGSRHMPTFVGRPIMEILYESATVPTSEANVYERTSMLRYLGEIRRVEEVRAARVQPTNFASVDTVLATLRGTGKTYAVGAVPHVPVRSEEAGRPRADRAEGLTWDELRAAAAQGHELANHLVSHARLTSLDEANLYYEVDKAQEDLRAQVGERHTFSIEAPYGIRDERVRQILTRHYPLTRNWVSDLDAEFMEGIMRGNRKDPGTVTRPYTLWERGPVSATTMEEMTGWIDTSLKHGTWLVLVIHGVEGIGYEPIPKDRLAACFDYVKARTDRLWVATFQDGSRYMRERMKASVVTREAGSAIEVTVAHPLDPEVYDLPLTARTTVPSSWTSADVRQGNARTVVPVRREAARAFVQYRVVPNASVVRIEEAR